MTREPILRVTKALALAAATLCMACAHAGPATPKATETTSATFAAPRAPESAWRHYERAITLHHGGETASAVTEYREAETRFGESTWGKSLAIYGRARALDDAGRCAEASDAYDEFAALVQSSDPEAAAMARAYAPLCRPDKMLHVDLGASEVSTAVVARDYGRAVALAERARLDGAAVPRPWLDYNRAVALAELQRTDEAVRAFESAERGFAGNHDAHGRAIAIYGRARALDNGGRCAAATKAYEEYGSFVGNAQDAASARAVARLCDAQLSMKAKDAVTPK